jgi:hypothetical protein
MNAILTMWGMNNSDIPHQSLPLSTIEHTTQLPA